MRSASSGFFAFVLFLAIAVLLIGCAISPPELGPKPEIYGLAMESWKSQAIDDFRAWLIALDPKSATQLRKTGEVSFNYVDLQTQDPTHAAMVAKYARTLDAKQTEKTGLIFRSTPQTITFRWDKDKASGKFIRGQYSVVIQFAEGADSTLALSYPILKGAR